MEPVYVSRKNCDNFWQSHHININILSVIEQVFLNKVNSFSDIFFQNRNDFAGTIFYVLN